jgi:Right handed beta helix region
LQGLLFMREKTLVSAILLFAACDASTDTSANPGSAAGSGGNESLDGSATTLRGSDAARTPPPQASEAGADAGSGEAGPEQVAPNALYVSVDGSDSSDGQSEKSAWRTISHALLGAAAGNTIYVKAGAYTESVTFNKSGTSDKPIALVGYSRNPGDNPHWPTPFNVQSSLYAQRMPLIQGPNRAVNVGVELSGRAFVKIRNLQITGFSVGVLAYGSDNVLVDNVVVAEVGDRDASYSGVGIKLGSSATKSTVKDCVVLNAAAEGITVEGNDNVVDRSSVYANDDSTANSATDYYIIVAGNGNTVKNSSVERIGKLKHLGHGIGLKTDAERNTIIGNKAKGIAGSAFYARYRGVKHNTFTDNLASDSEGFGFTIRDGASENIIDNLKTINVWEGVSFFDTSEDEGKQFSGRANIIRNSSFVGTTHAVISFLNYIYNDTLAETNTFDHISVDGAPYLFSVGTLNSGNVMRNSSIKNVKNLVEYVPPYSPGDLHFLFETGNTFAQNGFPNP